MKLIKSKTDKLNVACQFCGSIWQLDSQKDIFQTTHGMSAGYKCGKCRRVNGLNLPSNGLPTYRQYLEHELIDNLRMLHMENPAAAHEVAIKDFSMSLEDYHNIINEYTYPSLRGKIL